MLSVGGVVKFHDSYIVKFNGFIIYICPKTQIIMDSQGRKVIVCDNGTGVRILHMFVLYSI